ncbi:hypothetical protein EVAR_10758_1 [Eumeta japonica]|uniref:Uncharacterized protein n=1 Tax=Eumeta variegata TaxID=151549 RepID=A0A4C1W7D6_EUMVA|nr:hypothetical protein EVAR_10758_1 [Eumeta japonica]
MERWLKGVKRVATSSNDAECSKAVRAENTAITDPDDDATTSSSTVSKTKKRKQALAVKQMPSNLKLVMDEAVKIILSNHDHYNPDCSHYCVKIMAANIKHCCSIQKCDGCLGVSGTNPDHGRSHNASQFKPLAPCLKEHTEPLLHVVVVSILTTIFYNPQAAPAWRGVCLSKPLSPKANDNRKGGRRRARPGMGRGGCGARGPPRLCKRGAGSRLRDIKHRYSAPAS